MGSWIHVSAPSGTVLLLIGDMLHFASQGAAAPTLHRPPVSVAPRRVLAFFVYPDKGTLLGPSLVPPMAQVTSEQYSAWHTLGCRASAVWHDEGHLLDLEVSQDIMGSRAACWLQRAQKRLSKVPQVFDCSRNILMDDGWQP